MIQHRDIHKVLEEHWGYSSFRPLQEDIINSVLAGNDVLALLPTGGGKSICFQVPALAIDGLCLVVSPLIALMKDQVQNLKQRGVKADALFTGQSLHEQMRIIDNVIYNDTKFLYVSPERLKTDTFLLNINKLNITLIAVDEAHCISQWGYDFRPPYLEIAEIRKHLPGVPVMALTATATPRVVKDIQDKLKFKEYNVLQKSFARSNLSYLVYKEENKLGRLLRIANNVEGTGIVYMRNRRGTVEIADYLKKNNISADFYHAGLDDKQRSKKQSDWKSNKIRIIVATNAFGMGIDKPDVRFVVHLDIPDNIESYFQEVGRAGRDEKSAFGVLLYNLQDVENLKKRFNDSYPDIKTIQRVYAALGRYYNIPVATGEFLDFDFDIADFCQKYKFNQIVVYSSLKVLVTQNVISLSDAFESPSRVMMKVSQEDLYNYQISHEELNPFIQTLLRTYGGLFTEYTRIEETTIARRCNMKVDEVRKILNYLSKHNILDYIPYSDSPKITFVKPLLHENNVFTDVELYKQRKKIAKEQLDYMLAYVENSSKCRSSMLLQYFGEDNNNLKCRVCDFCRNATKKLSRKDLLAEVETVIFPLLRNNEMSMDEIHSKLYHHDISDILTCFRWLKDNDRVGIKENGNYYLK